jgi:hypothetical protein
MAQTRMNVASRIWRCYHVDYEWRGVPKGRGEFDRDREKVATKEVGELKRNVPGKGVKRLRQCQESPVGE